MRSLVLLIAAAMLTAGASPPPPTDLENYEQAISSLELDPARTIVDRLIRERAPADGKPRSDPLLNALIGRLYLVARAPSRAAPFLDRAPIDQLPDALRAPTALDHAHSLDLRGDRAAALTAYRAAAIASQQEDQRRRAELGIARELIVQDPASARDQLLPIANGPAEPHRWEARYLLAMSSSLLGDRTAAAKWADEAWSDSAAAALTDIAPVRVATLRAGLAAAAGDRASEQAMLAASHGLNLSATGSLGSQLPVCGDSGVLRTDYVIFGYVAGPFLTRELVPIAASRPAAVAPFQDALAGFSLITENSGEMPIGTVFTVHCRTLVSPYFVASSEPDDTIDWGVDHGLYYASVFNEPDDAHLRPIDAWIDSLSSRFGKDSPLLIMPRWQLLTALEARAVAGDPVLPSQLADLRVEIAAGMRRAGAPEWIASAVELQTQVEQLAKSAANGTDERGAVRQIYRKQLLESPFSVGRKQVINAIFKSEEDWPGPAAQLIVDLNQKMPPSLPLRDRQAWQMVVAEAQRALGKPAQARAGLLGAGLPADACPVMDSDPKLLEQHFSANDYPQNLVLAGEEGAVMFEFDLSSKGAPTQPRVIYSLPSGIFDDVSGKGLASVRYTPPTRGGAPAACRGLTQPIKWQLQGDSTFSFPIVAPQSPGPTT